MPKVDFKNPRTWAIAAGVAFFVYYVFLRKDGPSAAQVQPRTSAAQDLAQNPSPNYQPGTSNEGGSGGADPQVTGGLLSTLGQLADTLLGQSVVFANYSTATTGQVFQYAQATNREFGDITRSVIANPPMVTNTVFYPTGTDAPGSGGGGNTATTAPGGTPAPYVPPAQTFQPSYDPRPYEPPTFSLLPVGTSGLKQIIPAAAGPVSPPVVPSGLTAAQQAVRQASGRGPQA